jgi:hypothetical protein
MISEKQLIRGFKHMWNSWFPMLNYETINYIINNSHKTNILTHWANKIDTDVPALFNDLIAEIAFNSFASDLLNRENGYSSKDIKNSDIEQAFLKMSLIRGSKFDYNLITQEMLKDAHILKERLLTLYKGATDIITLNPKLHGYGILSSCYADLIIGTSIIEIKSSKDFFRVEDFKQIFLYAFLSHQNKIIINDLTLLNPRRGEMISLNKIEFWKLFSINGYHQTIYNMEQDLR